MMCFVHFLANCFVIAFFQSIANIESLLFPFIIMFTIPFAFTGVFLALWMTSKNDLRRRTPLHAAAAGQVDHP